MEKFSSRGPADKARRPDSAVPLRRFAGGPVGGAAPTKCLSLHPGGNIYPGTEVTPGSGHDKRKRPILVENEMFFGFFLFVSSRPQEDKRINNILLESQQNTTFSDFFSLFFVQAIWQTAGKRKTFSYQLMYFRFGKT